jgi:hypothetical protein
MSLIRLPVRVPFSSHLLSRTIFTDVCALIRFGLGVTIWANQSQIIGAVVISITINVVEFYRNGLIIPLF